MGFNLPDQRTDFCLHGSTDRDCYECREDAEREAADEEPGR